ncbi:MAG: class II D-tagatose-bisphosphate aldolase, non-catalytic subunit [Eubacteriales bacterium]
MIHPLKTILSGGSAQQTGAFSVCSASPLVLRTAARHAKQYNYTVIIEATANQVNQFGGYTGMVPAEYAAMVFKIAAEEGLDESRVILGGDHLGPLNWQGLPEDEAMANSEELVTQYTLAGFTKIHLDTSMRVATDDQNAALDVRVCAKRGARLANCVKAAYEKLLETKPEAMRPVLVIGSEVPIPGGSQEHEDSITPTNPDEFRRQYGVFTEEFKAVGAPIEDVVGFVVQPGVEFGDDFAFQYNRENAANLVGALSDYAPLVFEGHSTDYQTTESLSNMVTDGIKILKVGPALTFGLREALFLLEHCEEVMIADPAKRSHVKETILAEMNANTGYWKKYYQGTEEEIEYKKLYSYSDRCRYYLPAPAIDAAITKLLENTKDVPMALICQYLPHQYWKVMDGKLSTNGTDLVIDRIGNWHDIYAIACGVEI